MKAWHVACIMGPEHYGDLSGCRNRPVATVPGAMPEAVVSAGSAQSPALSAVAPEAPPHLQQRLRRARSATAAASGRRWPEPKSATIPSGQNWRRGATTMSLAGCRQRRDVPKTRCPQVGAGDAGFPVSHLLRLVRIAACQEVGGCRLACLQGHPARNAGRGDQARFRRIRSGLPFMKAVAKIESSFNPNQRTGSYIGLFQLSEYEFGKFGSERFAVPATMPLRPPTKSSPKAFCSSG